MRKYFHPNYMHSSDRTSSSHGYATGNVCWNRMHIAVKIPFPNGFNGREKITAFGNAYVIKINEALRIMKSVNKKQHRTRHSFLLMRCFRFFFFF